MTRTEQYIEKLVAEYVPTGGELSKIDKLILRTQLERLVLLAKVELSQEIEQEIEEKKAVGKAVKA